MSVHSLMFGWEYPPHHSGGLGVACQGLVQGLLHQGVKVTLVLPMRVDGMQDHISASGMTDGNSPSLVGVPSLLQPYDTVASYEARSAQVIEPELLNLYGPDLGEAVMRYAERGAEVTSHLHPDVVHTHDWMTYGAGITAAKHHRVPHVAHIHATELDRTNFQPHQWIYDREREGLMQADRIIAVSQYTKQLLIQHYGIREDRIQVVHNGHHIHDHIPSVPVVQHGKHRPQMVLFLGRMTVQKNPRQFLDIAARIHKLRPDVQFVMAGDGGMLSELIDYACALGLQDRILFSGKVNKREGDTLYKAASCFVMPSVSEPFGLVALEAISHGVPVVVSKQSGVGEVLDHAFKVDFWDTDRMTDCILTILRENSLHNQMSSESRHVLGRLTWKNQAGHIDSVYRSLLSSSR